MSWFASLSSTDAPATYKSSNVQYVTATPAQEEHISVNFVLFDSSNPRKPVCVDIPRALFAGKAQNCRNLFSIALLDEFGINATKTSINFWKPNKHLELDTATKRGWTKDIGELEEFCTAIPLPRSFALALEHEKYLDDIVHLLVTVDPPEVNPSTNSAQDGAAYVKSGYAHLPDLERRILEYLLSKSDSARNGVHIGDIAKAIADNDAFQISTALENLLNDGVAYNTVDEEHFLPTC